LDGRGARCWAGCLPSVAAAATLSRHCTPHHGLRAQVHPDCSLPES
jgi:hypothetical protein